MTVSLSPIYVVNSTAIIGSNRTHYSTNYCDEFLRAISHLKRLHLIENVWFLVKNTWLFIYWCDIWWHNRHLTRHRPIFSCFNNKLNEMYVDYSHNENFGTALHIAPRKMPFYRHFEMNMKGHQVIDMTWREFPILYHWHHISLQSGTEARIRIYRNANKNCVGAIGWKADCHYGR